jgi:hypothetical protein
MTTLLQKHQMMKTVAPQFPSCDAGCHSRLQFVIGNGTRVAKFIGDHLGDIKFLLYMTYLKILILNGGQL